MPRVCDYISLYKGTNPCSRPGLFEVQHWQTGCRAVACLALLVIRETSPKLLNKFNSEEENIFEQPCLLTCKYFSHNVMLIW